MPDPELPASGPAGPWAALAAELDLWAASGQAATLWWRDDDAADATPELARLLALADASGVAPALAVIPARASAALRECLHTQSRVAVLQHGYAHRNHAPAPAKKMELGVHRDEAIVAEELRQGRQVLAQWRGFLPVLVPPWNRIDERMRARLPACGLRGLSLFGPRAAARDAHGLYCLNTHLDPIAWRGDRGFCGEQAALAQLLAHLRARRAGECDPDEATGLLSHHLVQDQATWDFCARLFAVTAEHAGARWRSPGELFGSTRGRG